MNLFKLLSAFLLIILAHISFAQNNIGFIWQRKFGGTNQDFGNAIAKTYDGGFIVAGATTSNDGDVGPGSRDSSDVWVIKFNETGAIQWKKTYGGLQIESARKIIQTSDGGYLLLANTSSNNGDVSGNKGGDDVWVVKLNTNGVIQWQRCLGGSSMESGVNLTVTQDGGIVVGILTNSTNGDVVGKTTNDDDIWVVKLNSTGTTILWQKIYGGSTSEWFRGFQPTSDGGFLCSGSTTSNNGDFTGGSFVFQNFLIKLDNNGNKIFAKKLIGTEGYIGNMLLSSENGSIYIGGKNVNQRAYIVKANSNGDVVWNKQYYFNIDTAETAYQVVFSSDKKSLFFVGHSIALNGYPQRAWVAKADTTIGTLDWVKYSTAFPNTFIADLVIQNDSLPLMVGSLDYTNPNTFYPSDMLVLKLGVVNKIKGTLYYDANSNGIKDANELNFNNAIIKTQKVGTVFTTQPNNGSFSFDVDTGSYTTTVQLFNPYYSVVPASRNTNFTTYFNTDSFGFAIQPIPNQQDLIVHLIPASPARPGFKAQYVLNYKNIGTTTIANGTVKFVKDPRTAFSLSLPLPTAVLNDTAFYNYTNLKPLDSIAVGIELQLLPPPTLNINDTLKLMVTISPVAGDLTPSNDTSSLRQRVVGSYDPNDKLESFAGKIPLKNVQDGSYINYVIRFQNTGTDTAFFVRLLDTLDTKLDWNSFQMIGSSHAYNLSIKDGNKLNWFFDNIKLPDSTTNLIKSNGYVAFRIKPKNNLLANDIISNRASIYFDYNLPVVTNTTNTLVFVETITGVRGVQNNEMILVLGPNPANGYSLLQISGKLTGKFELRVIDNNGRIISQQSLRRNSIAETLQVPLNMQQFSSGVYYIQLQQKEKSWWQKVVVQ